MSQILINNSPRTFRAPGRVNLIGEHTDYNDGFVMPAAIDLSVFVRVWPETIANSKSVRKILRRDRV